MLAARQPLELKTHSIRSGSREGRGTAPITVAKTVVCAWVETHLQINIFFFFPNFFFAVFFRLIFFFGGGGGGFEEGPVRRRQINPLEERRSPSPGTWPANKRSGRREEEEGEEGVSRCEGGRTQLPLSPRAAF